MSETVPIMAQGTEVTPVTGGTVEVVAPADLKEGYALSVTINGAVRSVTVPAGGVKEGQSFQATPFVDPNAMPSIPTGHWRDGLCACCKFGCCHAMCCLGWCCQPILTGQVMTRMSLSWMGGPGERPSVSKTCQIVTGIFLGTIVLNTILQAIMDSQSCVGGQLKTDNGNYIQCPDGSKITPVTTAYMVSFIILSIVGSLYGLYNCWIICRTRASIRGKFGIGNGACGGCEDCCCAVCCPCCTVQQMARHTNDYASHDVSCCSSDCFNNRGQQTQVPEIEV